MNIKTELQNTWRKTHRTARRNKYTIILRDFNSPFFIIDRTSRWKINMHIEALHHTSDTCRTMHLTSAEYKLIEYTPLIHTRPIMNQSYKTGSENLEKKAKAYISSLLISLTQNIPYCKK